MNEFRDALLKALRESIDSGSDSLDEDMDAVLSTPEMQSIRRVLREHCWFLLHKEAAIYADPDSRLTSSVIDWVVGDE